MGLKEKIQKEMTNALKTGDKIKSSVLRMLVSSIVNAEISLKKKEEGLSEEEIQKVVKAEAKKRSDAIDAYKKADRLDIAEKEEQELAMLKEYLPEEMPEEEIEKIAKEIMSKKDADSAQNFGQIMGEVMKKTEGRADGKKVSEIVKLLLET